MVKLSKESKQRLQQVFRVTQFAIRWGFIPTVLYLGQYRRWPAPGLAGRLQSSRF
ncbi:mitochondrial import receptor subunit TOM7 homolog isoform X2 [Mobula birostris]|uniref:mitochondrial import receptor subunit TOM7 homolog isoform X2 n=1 Tax=Mobula birostris TaxID=1983395 RepID=UPI003B27BBDA